MFSADKLKKGCPAVIRELKCSGVLLTRLCDLGAVPGTEIELSGAAPFGDPLMFHLRGYTLSLAKNDAANILVDYREAI